MRANKSSLLGIGLLSGVLAGCSSTPSSYTPYPDQLNPIRQQVQQGGFDAAVQGLQAGINSADSQLYLLEEARVLQVQGDYADSINAYDQVIAASGQSLLAKAQSGPSFSQILDAGNANNGNDYPYLIQPYEMMLAYQNEALAYLAKGDLQGALTDFHQANDLEDSLAFNYMNAVNKSLQPYENPSALDKLFSGGFPSFTAVLANTYNPQNIAASIQNGFIDLIASMAFFNAGDYTAANQQMQRALEMTPPNNALLNTQTLKMMQMTKQSSAAIAAQAKQLGVTSIPTVDLNKAQVWVMLEEGFVPFKQQKSYAISDSVVANGSIDNTTYSMMLPIYGAPPTSNQFNLSVNNVLSPFTPFLNIADLAAASLREQYAGQYQNATAAVNAEESQLQMDATTLQLAQGQDAQDEALAQVQSDEIDNPTPADLRSWSMLPNDIQLAELDLAPGQHTVLITDNNKTALANCSIKVSLDKIALVWVNLQAQKPVCLQLL